VRGQASSELAAQLFLVGITLVAVGLAFVHPALSLWWLGGWFVAVAWATTSSKKQGKKVGQHAW